MNTYNNEAIVSINNLKDRIEVQRKTIEDCEFNIKAYEYCLVSKIRDLYILISPKTIKTVLKNLNSEEKDDDYKDCYDYIVSIIKSMIIKDTECNYKKQKLIDQIIICGYEGYGYQICFTVNKTEFMFNVPVLANIHSGNMEYANYGKYELICRTSPCSTSVICASYNIDDLAEAFKEFICNEKTVS